MSAWVQPPAPPVDPPAIEQRLATAQAAPFSSNPTPLHYLGDSNSPVATAPQAAPEKSPGQVLGSVRFALSPEGAITSADLATIDHLRPDLCYRVYAVAAQGASSVIAMRAGADVAQRLRHHAKDIRVDVGSAEPDSNNSDSFVEIAPSVCP